MTKIPFIKMNGLGNDFIIIDCRGDLPTPTTETIIALSNRRTGIGCDQFIILETPTGNETVFMRMHNANGEQVGACGNATRCVGRLIMEQTGQNQCTIATISDTLHATWADESNKTVTINMGNPKLAWQEIPLLSAHDTTAVALNIPNLPPAQCVNMGNPHAVFFVPDVESFDITHYGKIVETHPQFPEKTNAEFVEKIGDTTLRMRVWERGVGITQACGTGACAVAVCAIQSGMVQSDTVDIVLDGGTLTIQWQQGGAVYMTGATALSFTGEAETPC